MANRPRLRDGRRLITKEPFRLNDFPEKLIYSLGGYFVYLIYTGRKDFTGTDWGDALADAVGGKHLGSPVGIADVVLGKMAWSAKTVKEINPFTAQSVRLISGRCSPDYSYGIEDPHKDIQKTGEAVLNIWNERINIAYDYYNPVRTSVLLRSNDLLSFRLFEEENQRFRTNDYEWQVNRNGNLIGVNKETGETRFTWQPHGSQLTIHTHVPESAVKFRIRKPPVISKADILDHLKFNESWVEIMNE